MRVRTLAAGLAATLAVAAAPALDTDTSGAVAFSPGSEVTDVLAGDGCDELDPTLCLLPFPNDRFTVEDPTTATGVRLDLSALAMPRNTAGKPVDPTEWNRNDGFSPGSPILTFVPGLDLHRTFETDRDVIEDPALSVDPDGPIALVNAATGERHPFIAELDRHPDTADDERMLVLRPLRNLEEGARYVVGLRKLRDAAGALIEPRETFRRYRDGEADDARADEMEDVFHVLEEAGIGRRKLYLAWDFTVASAEGLAGRALHIRDDAFAALGDADLADGEVAGEAPAFTVDRVEDYDEGTTARRVYGTVTVPNYLQLPQDELTSPEADDPTGALEDLPAQMVPGSRFYYGPDQQASPAPDAMPRVNPLAPTLDAEFVCSVPRSAVDGEPATPMLYGHGLLGGKGESTGGSTEQMRRRGFMPCGVDWIGMATEDVANVATILTDVSNFASLADRAQQGFLDFLYVGRALVHPDGLSTDPAFTGPDGTPLFTAGGLVYDGNSQGGIMGGSLTALAPDLTRATIGVPGMNYSTLLNRSVDWEGAYGEIMYAAYPDKREQQLIFALIQQLWDRAEGNGYAHHMTDDPYPNTPAHQVLMQVAYGDYQVANLAAEVQGRTIGARRIATDLAAGRHWSIDPLFGFESIDGPYVGSALVYFDSGNPAPPNANVPPEDLDADPHEHPRRDPFGADQKLRFYRTGEIVDVHDGEAYWTYRCPVHPDDNPGC